MLAAADPLGYEHLQMAENTPRAEDLPPPIPPAEMPEAELSRIVDEGLIAQVEAALREQNVRLPQVLFQLDRVLEAGQGNLATALVTMLISSFHVARASQLAERVLRHASTAGVESLADLAASLMQQERLLTARKVLTAAIEKDPHHDRARYLSARVHARRGYTNDAFVDIAKVNPKLLEGTGLLYQARYALLTGRTKAKDSALRLAKKHLTAEEYDVTIVDHVDERVSLSGWDASSPMSLRAAMAIEYGSALVEVARAKHDGGRFGMDAIALADVGRLLRRIVESIAALGLPLRTLYHATEDGEIVAAAIAEATKLPYREWRADRAAQDGDWIVMASAGTHPHLDNKSVRALHDALEEGTLRSLALVLPCGFRGPVVPDFVGRITGDDELPWLIDDEVDETVDLIFDDREASADLHVDDPEALAGHIERFGGLFRAARSLPRPPHVPFLDETPVPRGE